ncbi:MAG: Crp/Fnr family transcriptional regulator [Solirubrobacteraceae bacterium]
MDTQALEDPIRNAANGHPGSGCAATGCADAAPESTLSIEGERGHGHALDRWRMRPPVKVRTIQLTPGRGQESDLYDQADGWLGVLIMEGLILVELDAERGKAGWLVGADDLLRPWEMDEVPLLSERSWRVLTPTRLALLDRDFAERASGDPEIWTWSLARLAQTTHWLLAKTLVISSPAVEERLALLFTLLAERWGRVTPQGIRLDLPLTHTVLARMVGARRPTVSVALKTLETQGQLIRAADRGYMLRHADAAYRRAEGGCWSRCTLALGL